METHRQTHQGRFATVLNLIQDGIYITDADRRIIYWNKGAERITGYRSAEVVGRSCSDNILVHVDAEGTNLCTGDCPLGSTICDRKQRDASVFLHHKEGHRVPVQIRTSLLEEKESAIQAIELFTDISEQTAKEIRIRELEQLAMLDPLTRLANRTYIENEIDCRINEFRKFSVPFGIIFLDIDHFKGVNDTYGHLAGDSVLRLIANTLSANGRPFDLFGRFGGEEFIGIIRNTTEEHLISTAQRLRILTAASSLPYKEGQISVTISIGATMVRGDDTRDSIIERADSLMYRSKRDGRDRVTFSR